METKEHRKQSSPVSVHLLSEHKRREQEHNMRLIHAANTEAKDNPATVGEILTAGGNRVTDEAKKAALNLFIKKNHPESLQLILNQLTNSISYEEINEYIVLAIKHDAGKVIPLLDDYLRTTFPAEFKEAKGEILYNSTAHSQPLLLNPLKLAMRFNEPAAATALCELNYLDPKQIARTRDLPAGSEVRQAIENYMQTNGINRNRCCAIL